MSTTARSWLLDLVFLALFTSLLYGLFLGMRPLTPPDEGRYSEIPREMVMSHDYITPHLDGVIYFEKPVLFYWLQVVSIKLFGLHEWSLRLVNALMGGLGCLLTYFFTRKLYNRRTALLAGMLLSTSLLYAFLSRFITLDITTTTFLTGSLLCFLLGNQYPKGRARRFCMWGMYSLAALTVLTKGLIGIIFPGMIIFTWLLVTKQWRRLPSYSFISGTALFLAITVPWHLLVGMKNPGFFKFYFYDQHFLRYFTQYAGRGQPIWFLPLILILGWFPWMGFMLTALKKQLVVFKNASSHLTEVFLFLWPALIFFFYWMSHSQLSPYLLPVFPPLAILTAIYLNEMWQQKNKVLQLNFFIIGVINCLLAAGLLVFLNKSHLDIPIIYKLLVVVAALISAIGCNIVYQHFNLKRALITLFITNTIFSLTAYYTSSYFNTPSVKPLAIELKKMIKSTDTVYNYNHYFQDMPVYLGTKVVLLNWKGELEYGFHHNPPQGTFIHENKLWNNWNTSSRKFLVMTIHDFEEIKSILKDLQFYPVSQTQKFVLVCNKECRQ
jgi:4-amino-4-deoxy-L-arabinose transferase-like glycosyltransferase